MSRHLHLEPVGGVAGDMFVAAMLDLFPQLVDSCWQDLEDCGVLQHVTVELQSGLSQGLAVKRLQVNLKDQPARRTGHYRDLRALLEDSRLATAVKSRAQVILHTLAEAEAFVHGVEIETVHFHEVADWDSVVDIVAAASVIERSGVERWSCGPLPLGSGFVQTEHGQLPVPAPATAWLLKGLEVWDDGEPGERVTPTGAAIVRHALGMGMANNTHREHVSRECSTRVESEHLSRQHSTRLESGDSGTVQLATHESVARGEILYPGQSVRPAGIMIASGCGAGQRTLRERPNILRCQLIESPLKLGSHDPRARASVSKSDTPGLVLQAGPGQHVDQVAQLSFDIDDMTPEELSVSLDHIRSEAGVLDACFCLGMGKKGRALFSVTVLCAVDAESRVSDRCLEETTTLGMRVQLLQRRILQRTQARVTSDEGREVGIKSVMRPGDMQDSEAVSATTPLSGSITAKIESDDLASTRGLQARRRLAWQLREPVEK